MCIAHGVTTSMYYQDPDRNFVELQIDRFAEPDAGHRLHARPEYAADSVGPAFDPEELLAARRAGASVEDCRTGPGRSRQICPTRSAC